MADRTWAHAPTSGHWPFSGSARSRAPPTDPHRRAAQPLGLVGGGQQVRRRPLRPVLDEPAQADDSPLTRITVKEIVFSQELAEQEVKRLMLLNAEKGCLYFATPTRVRRLSESENGN